MPGVTNAAVWLVFMSVLTIGLSGEHKRKEYEEALDKAVKYAVINDLFKPLDLREYRDELKVTRILYVPPYSKYCKKLHTARPGRPVEISYMFQAVLNPMVPHLRKKQLCTANIEEFYIEGNYYYVLPNRKSLKCEDNKDEDEDRRNVTTTETTPTTTTKKPTSTKKPSMTTKIPTTVTTKKPTTTQKPTTTTTTPKPNIPPRPIISLPQSKGMGSGIGVHYKVENATVYLDATNAVEGIMRDHVLKNSVIRIKLGNSKPSQVTKPRGLVARPRGPPVPGRQSAGNKSS